FYCLALAVSQLNIPDNETEKTSDPCCRRSGNRCLSVKCALCSRRRRGSKSGDSKRQAYACLCGARCGPAPVRNLAVLWHPAHDDGRGVEPWRWLVHRNTRPVSS